MTGLSKTLAGLAIIVQAGATGANALPLTPFRYQDQAQRHCPDDTVVWLDFSKGRYYSKGQKLYGRGLIRPQISERVPFAKAGDAIATVRLPLQPIPTIE